jgi:hypothetical protein
VEFMDALDVALHYAAENGMADTADTMGMTHHRRKAD